MGKNSLDLCEIFLIQTPSFTIRFTINRFVVKEIELTQHAVLSRNTTFFLRFYNIHVTSRRRMGVVATLKQRHVPAGE